jgi:hypothetical protein
MRRLTLAFVLLFGFTLTVFAQSDDWYSVPGTQLANPNNLRRAAAQPRLNPSQLWTRPLEPSRLLAPI